MEQKTTRQPSPSSQIWKRLEAFVLEQVGVPGANAGLCNIFHDPAITPAVPTSLR